MYYGDRNTGDLQRDRMYPGFDMVEDGMDITDYLDLYGLGDLSEELDRMFPEWDFSLNELLYQLLRGEFTEALQALWQQLISGMEQQLSSYRSLAVLLLFLGILGAFYQVFSASFREHQIADLGYYVFYVAMVGILLKAFWNMQQIAVDFLEQMLLFMKLFLPTFCVCVGTAAGSITAGTTYSIAFFLLFLVGKIVRVLLLPALGIYVFLALINGLWEEERLSTLLDQMKSLLQVSVKGVLYSVFGITLIRNAITPVLDQFTGSVIQRVLSSIPGVGNVTNVVWQTTMGAAILIKNSVGVAFVLLLLFLGMVPLCAVAAFAMVLKIDAALLGLLQDNRTVHCIERLGEGGFLLLKILFGSMAVFLVFIAMTVLITGG